MAVILLLMLGGASAHAQFNKAQFGQIGAIEGAWSERREGGTLYEVWERRNDTLLQGRSFTVRGRDTIPEETVVLSLCDGVIRYIPSVARQHGGRPVEFVLTRLDDSGFVFENAGHDFPQRIRYTPTVDALIALIGGTTKKGYKEFSFRYRRVSGSAPTR